MKNQNIAKVGLIALVALLLAAMPLVGACAPPAEVTPPEEEEVTPPEEEEVAPPKTVHVTIGGLLDQSGPTASGTLPGVYGLMDFIEYVNRQGGLDWSGGKVIIDLDLPDVRYDPAISYPAYEKMAAKGYPLILTHASHDNVGLLDKAARDKVVLLTMSPTSSAIFKKGWLFSMTPAYSDNFCGFLEWVKATWEGEEPAKIGTLTWDTAWGKAHLCAIDYVEELGMEYVGTEYSPIMPTDVTPQLGRLAKAGADFVWNQSTAPVPIIMKDMYRTDFPGVLVCSSNTPLDDYLAVVGYEVAAGTLHACPVIDWLAEPESEFVVYAQKVQLEVLGSLRTPGTFYPLGALCALMAQWLIPRALDACGGPDELTGQVIYDLLVTMEDVDFMGICMPLTLSPDERRGSMGVKMYEAQPDGSIKAVSDWIVCPDSLAKYPACAE